VSVRVAVVSVGGTVSVGRAIHRVLVGTSVRYSVVCGGGLSVWWWVVT